jgi:hypothetical protein
MPHALLWKTTRIRCGMLLVAAATVAGIGCRRKNPGAEQPRESSRTSGTVIIPVERGNACHQIAGPFPDTSLRDGTAAAASWRRTFARGAAYRCIVRATLPPVRLVIVGDTAAEWLDSLVIAPDSTGAPARQVLLLDSTLPPPWSANAVQMVDLDADGYNDLLVGDSWGATGNTRYQVWRFNSLMGRFVEDRELSEVFNPSPVPGTGCVHTHSNTSFADGESALLCRRDGHWTTDSIETSTWNRQEHVIVHEIRIRKGGSLIVVKRTIRPDSTP